jgi:hypothetical protein
MQIVRIKGTEYHSAKSQAEVEQFLADSGLVKTGQNHKQGDTLLAMFNSPFPSFGYKQYCEPEYTAKSWHNIDERAPFIPKRHIHAAVGSTMPHSQLFSTKRAYQPVFMLT